MAGTYRSIVRDYQLRFPHQVKLRNAYWWRPRHIYHQLRHLSRHEFGEWGEGDHRRGEDVRVWGFKCVAQAGCFEGWAADCGIDWSISPHDQVVRPPPPPEENWTKHLPPSVPHCENLRTLSQAAALGVTCTACGRLVALQPEALGAHGGNMQEIRTLRLVCKACGSREWTYRVLQTIQSAAEFLAGAT